MLKPEGIAMPLPFDRTSAALDDCPGNASDANRNGAIPLVTAIGVLHEDLVRIIGIKEAFRILERYGYLCGTLVACQLQDACNCTMESEFDMLVPDVLKSTLFGVEIKETPCEGQPSWRQMTFPCSPEAERHLLRFGRHNSPTCWFTAGLLTGIASVSHPKQDIIYREVSCVGHGDGQCVFTGKPAEEWGDIVLDELDGLEGLKNATGTLSARDPEYHNKANAIFNAISNLSADKSHGNDVALARSVNRLSEAFGCTVAIEELGVVTHFCVHETDRNPDGTAISSLGRLALGDSRSFVNTPTLYKGKRTSFFLTDNVAGFKVNRLVCPIVLGAQKLGYLSMIRVNYPFSQSDKELVERLPELFGANIAEQRQIRKFENKLLTSFVDNLITGKHMGSNPALDYSNEIGLDLSIPHRVVVVEIDDPEGKLPPPVHSHQSEDWIQVILSVAKKADLPNSRMVVVYRNKHLVAIMQDPLDCSSKRICQLAANLKDSLAEAFSDIGFTIGVGSACHSADDCKPSFEAACKVIEMGKKLGRSNEVLAVEQFSARTLLYGSLEIDTLVDFASLRLKGLIEFDRANSGELLVTLERFIENRGNSHRTAEDLSLSSGGLKYRLKNIEKITGQNLRETRAFYDFATALDILHLIGKDGL